MSPPISKHPVESVVPMRNSAGEWVRSDKHRASTFAEHPATNNFVLQEQTDVSQTTQDAIEFRPTESAKIIKELKPNKSPDSDLINPKMCQPFQEKHGTIEQVNRITTEIRTAFEK